MIFFVLINTAIFIMMSFVHVYWALSGNLGKSGVLPTLHDGNPVIDPGIIGTFAVAAAMGIFAFITVGDLGIYEAFIPHDVIKYATIVIGVIFMLRAMGDFKYMGFFKKIKGTHFARNDSSYFSPLCLYLGMSSIAIALLH
jgi:hypothetical protein